MSPARARPGCRAGKDSRASLAVIGATVLFVALLPILGMTLATALFLLGLLRFLEGHAWPITLGVAVATAVGNWAIFAWWLQVPFPVGVLGF